MGELKLSFCKGFVEMMMMMMMMFLSVYGSHIERRRSTIRKINIFNDFLKHKSNAS